MRQCKNPDCQHVDGEDGIATILVNDFPVDQYVCGDLEHVVAVYCTVCGFRGPSIPNRKEDNNVDVGMKAIEMWDKL